MCLLGWHHPESLTAFAKAMKELPEYFWFGFLTVLFSVAVPKMIQSSRSPQVTSVVTEVKTETKPEGSAKPELNDDFPINAHNPTLEALKRELK